MEDGRWILTQVLLLLLARERGRQHGGQAGDEGLIVLAAHPARATPPRPALGRRLADRPCARTTHDHVTACSTQHEGQREARRLTEAVVLVVVGVVVVVRGLVAVARFGARLQQLQLLLHRGGRRDGRGGRQCGRRRRRGLHGRRHASLRHKRLLPAAASHREQHKRQHNDTIQY